MLHPLLVRPSRGNKPTQTLHRLGRNPGPGPPISACHGSTAPSRSTEFLKIRWRDVILLPINEFCSSGSVDCVKKWQRRGHFCTFNDVVFKFDGPYLLSRFCQFPMKYFTFDWQLICEFVNYFSFQSLISQCTLRD